MAVTVSRGSCSDSQKPTLWFGIRARMPLFSEAPKSSVRNNLHLLSY